MPIAPVPQRSFRQRIEALEQEVFRRQVNDDFAAGLRNHARDWWLAKVLSESDPEDGYNAYNIVFVDGDFSRTEGVQPVTLTDRSASHQEVGLNLSETHLELNDYVFAFFDGRRWWLIPLKSGSADSGMIMFRIVEATYCGECTARVQILSHPVGVDPQSLPGVDQEYDGRYFVTVYDKTYPQSCFLNEPPEDLLNRIGFATYLNALEDGPCPDTFGPRWHIHSLCCKDSLCE